MSIDQSREGHHFLLPKKSSVLFSIPSTVNGVYREAEASPRHDWRAKKKIRPFNRRLRGDLL